MASRIRNVFFPRCCVIFYYPVRIKIAVLVSNSLIFSGHVIVILSRIDNNCLTGWNFGKLTACPCRNLELMILRVIDMQGVRLMN